MAGNEVHNKNAAGGPPRLRPFWMERPTGGDGAHAANAGEQFSSSWLNLPESGNVDFSKFNPDKKAMSLEEQFPAGMSLHAKNPPVTLDSTQARTGPLLPLYNDPKRTGTPAYRHDGGSYQAPAQAPQQSAAPAPAPAPDDGFTAFLTKEAAEKAAKTQQTMAAQQPKNGAPSYIYDGRWNPKGPKFTKADVAARSLPPSYLWDQRWKTGKDAVDSKLISQLAAETQAADGPVVSAQTPDSSAYGPAEAIDPDLLDAPAEGGDPALAEEGFTLDPNDIGLRKFGPEQAPVGEHPIDEEVMAGVLEGKTPTPETPEEESRIAYLQSQRGINAGRELAGQDAMRAQIARLEGYSQMDYRPLAALVDTWTGSKMAPSFAGPIDREPLIAQLNAAIQKGDQHLSDADMQELKDYNDNQARLEAAGLRGNGADGSAKITAATVANDRKVEAARLAVENKIKAASLAQKNALEIAKLVAGDKAELKKVEVANALAEKDTNHATGLVNSPANKELGTSTGMADNLRRYRAAVKKYGLAPTGFHEGSERLTALYEEYTSLRKDLDKLGQLTASDLAIVRKQLPNATDAGYASLKLLQGKDGKQLLLDQIDETLAVLRRQGDARIGTIRTAYGSNTNYPITIQTVGEIETTMKRAFGDFIPPHKGGFKDLTPEQRTENKAAMDQYRKGE